MRDPGLTLCTYLDNFNDPFPMVSDINIPVFIKNRGLIFLFKEMATLRGKKIN